MDYVTVLADFARWIDAGASTVVGVPEELASAYLRERAGRQQLIPGNTVGA
jgi:hypothetical protein